MSAHVSLLAIIHDGEFWIKPIHCQPPNAIKSVG